MKKRGSEIHATAKTARSLLSSLFRLVTCHWKWTQGREKYPRVLIHGSASRLRLRASVTVTVFSARSGLRLYK